MGDFKFVIKPTPNAPIDSEAFTQHVLRVASDIFREQRQLKMSFIVYATLPLPALVGIEPFDDGVNFDPDHDWVHRGIREIAKSLGARALFSVSEIWIGQIISPSGRVPNEYRPRNDPQRKEAAMVMVENPHARPPMQMWMAHIERNKGRPHLLEWTQTVDPGTGKPPADWEGRLTYLLPREAYGKTGSA